MAGKGVVLLLLLLGASAIEADFLKQARQIWEDSTWKDGLAAFQLVNSGLGVVEFVSNWRKETPWVDGTKCWGTKEDRDQICSIQKTCKNGAFTKAAGWIMWESYCCYNQTALKELDYSLDDGS